MHAFIDVQSYDYWCMARKQVQLQFIQLISYRTNFEYNWIGKISADIIHKHEPVFAICLPMHN